MKQARSRTGRAGRGMSAALRQQLPGNGGRGMNWIRPAKRLAIYHRDGVRCVWCKRRPKGIGADLFTLDHLIPRLKGGSNDPDNVVTSCLGCNRRRGDRPWRSSAKRAVVALVERLRFLPLDVQAAKSLISRSGGFAAALYR